MGSTTGALAEALRGNGSWDSTISFIVVALHSLLTFTETKTRSNEEAADYYIYMHQTGRRNSRFGRRHHDPPLIVNPAALREGLKARGDGRCY